MVDKIKPPETEPPKTETDVPPKTPETPPPKVSPEPLVPPADEPPGKPSVDSELNKTDTKEPEWPVYEDKALAAAAGMIKESGISVTEAHKIFEKAAQSNNLDDIDLTVLEKKLGKDKTALVMIGVKDYFDRNMAAVKETVSEVHKIFGGEEQYNTVREWALEKGKTDKVFANDIEKYGEMFNAGGVSARAAAHDMFRQYKADPKTSGLEVKMLNGNKLITGADGLTPINRADYVRLLKIAHAKQDSKMIEQLDAQRRLGMKAGLK